MFCSGYPRYRPLPNPRHCAALLSPLRKYFYWHPPRRTRLGSARRRSHARPHRHGVPWGGLKRHREVPDSKISSRVPRLSMLRPCWRAALPCCRVQAQHRGSMAQSVQGGDGTGLSKGVQRRSASVRPDSPSAWAGAASPSAASRSPRSAQEYGTRPEGFGVKLKGPRKGPDDARRPCHGYRDRPAPRQRRICLHPEAPSTRHRTLAGA